MGWMVTHEVDIRPPGPYQGYLNDSCVTLAEVTYLGAATRLVCEGDVEVVGVTEELLPEAQK